MNFASAEKIAAAVLYEGYILYPYRASAIKNRQRWNFGTLYPRMYAEAQRPQEAFSLRSEFLIVPDEGAKLDLKVSFLQLLPKTSVNEDALPSPVDPSLDWDEAVERTHEEREVQLSDLRGAELNVDLKPGPGLAAKLALCGDALPTGAYKLRLELQNVSEVPSGAAARRYEALPQSFVSAHVLVGVTHGSFVSLLEPEDRYVDDAKTCVNQGVFPVLAGDEPERLIMLLSPIILHDYPKTSPVSAGDFFDGTEMDEMLTLRVLTLTDEEKEEMRNGDTRARQILERTEALSGEEMLRAHGIVRPLPEIRGERA